MTSPLLRARVSRGYDPDDLFLAVTMRVRDGQDRHAARIADCPPPKFAFRDTVLLDHDERIGEHATDGFEANAVPALVEHCFLSGSIRTAIARVCVAASA